MGQARRRDEGEAQAAQPVRTAENRKDQPLSIGLSLLIWIVMAGLAWAAVALVLRLA